MTVPAKLVGHSILCFHNLMNGEVSLDDVEAFYLTPRSFERIQAIEKAVAGEEHIFPDGELMLGTVRDRQLAEALVAPMREARARKLLWFRPEAMGPVWGHIWSQNGQPYELA